MLVTAGVVYLEGVQSFGKPVVRFDCLIVWFVLLNGTVLCLVSRISDKLISGASEI
jgi:hypothetical protein